MSILDGLPEQALKDFGADFKDGTLLVPGAETDDGQGGHVAAEPTSYSCKALITDYSDYRRLTLGIPATDRQVLVLAASLPAGVIPAQGHQISAADPSRGFAPVTLDIIAKSGDPAGALYKLQAR